MPAWKKHEAGRRSRDAHESDGYYDAPQREAARNRIERLTRTATALGGGYDTRLDEPDDDLDAVADELDRLLSDQEKVAAPRSAAPRPDRPSRSPRRRAPVRDTGLEDVLGALDRLDQQVQGLAGEDDDYDDEEPYRAPERPRRRPGRYALDALREDAYPEGGDDYYDDEDERGYGRDYPPRERVGRARREESMHVYKDLGRRIDALRAPQEKKPSTRFARSSAPCVTYWAASPAAPMRRSAARMRSCGASPTWWSVCGSTRRMTTWPRTSARRFPS
ncbi:hypothetical protein QW131_02800 [Roseibium salinum]|nr:hypothetical protein [Roseibium salinum]